jgi:hypothetical protein
MSLFIQANFVQSNFVQGSPATATCFDANDFDPNDFFTCGPPPVVATAHGGLFLDPPPGWQAIGPNRRPPRHNGPLNPRNVLTHIDFNRDDPDELWLLGLEDLETN